LELVQLIVFGTLGVLFKLALLLVVVELKPEVELLILLLLMEELLVEPISLILQLVILKFVLYLVLGLLGKIGDLAQSLVVVDLKLPSDLFLKKLLVELLLVSLLMEVKLNHVTLLVVQLTVFGPLGVLGEVVL
jgi:hypothetical protein